MKMKMNATVLFLSLFATYANGAAEEVTQKVTQEVAVEPARTLTNWQVDADLGYYEKRISGGLYGAQDAAFVKASTKIGNFRGLSFVGSLEYVDSADYQLHTTLGTYIQTPIGGIDTRAVIHTIEGADTTFELNGAYDLNWFKKFDTSLTLALEDGSELGDEVSGVVTTPALNISKTLVTDKFDVTLGAEVGQSYGHETDYKYAHGYVRLDTVINEIFPVFIQVNALCNDLDTVNSISSEGTDGSVDTSVTVGMSLSF